MLKSVFRRRYRTVVAVDDVSFSIEPGERVGFLGPNGAGKTTTLKVLSGLLHPSSGSARVVGREPGRRDVELLAAITLVTGQKQQLIWDLPPAETFAYNRAVYEVLRERFDETLAELDGMLELGNLIHKPTRQLSLGERMRCELCAALLHGPRVLFLDEPTIGLDVSMQLKVRDFIRAHNEKTGATVLLTSHYMDDVAALCPRVIVIDKGKLRYDGALSKLVRSIRPDKRVSVRHTDELRRESFARIGAVIEHETTRTVIQVAERDLREAVGHLLASDHITDLTIEDPPLEEVMRELFAEAEPAAPPLPLEGP